MIKASLREPRVKTFISKPLIKDTIINTINYSYARHLGIATDDTPARNLSESLNSEVRFEVMLMNALLKSFRRNRNSEL